MGFHCYQHKKASLKEKKKFEAQKIEIFNINIIPQLSCDSNTSTEGKRVELLITAFKKVPFSFDIRMEMEIPSFHFLC